MESKYSKLQNWGGIWTTCRRHKTMHQCDTGAHPTNHPTAHCYLDVKTTIYIKTMIYWIQVIMMNWIPSTWPYRGHTQGVPYLRQRYTEGRDWEYHTTRAYRGHTLTFLALLQDLIGLLEGDTMWRHYQVLQFGHHLSFTHKRQRCTPNPPLHTHSWWPQNPRSLKLTTAGKTVLK